MPVGQFPMADDEIRAGKVWPRHGTPVGGDRMYWIESRLTLDADTGDGVATQSHQATGGTAYAPNAIDIYGGIFLFAESSDTGSGGTWSVSYDGPGAPFGGYNVGGSSYLSTVSVGVVLKNVRLYTMEGGALPRLMWDAVEVYVNGGLDITLPGSAIDATGGGVGPNYIPLLGIPLTVANSCSAGRANLTPWSYDPCDPDNADGRDYETAVTQSVYGGWQDRLATGVAPWIDYPLSPYSGSPADPGDCPFGLGGYAVTANRTWGILLTGTSRTMHQFAYEGQLARTQRDRQICEGSVLYDSGDVPSMGPNPCTGVIGPAYWDVYKTTSESEGASGQVELQPDLAKSLNRLATDFAKLLYRAELPETRASIGHFCTDGGVSASASSTPTVHPGMAELLGLVRDADHSALDLFDYPSYAPMQGGRSKSRSVSYAYEGSDPTSCPSMPDPPPLGTCLVDGDTVAAGWECVPTTVLYEGENKSESTSVAFPTYVGPEGGYQWHAIDEARYLGTWGNPHWHLFDWRQDWYLQGSDAPWAPVDEDTPGYWGPVRDQWLYNADLPSEDRPKTRSAMIGSPYYDWAHTPVFDAYTAGLPWTGTSRFKVREVTFPELLTLTAASEPMLSCPDGSCTVAIVGGNVVVSPIGSGPFIVDVDLVRADCYPFYGLLLTKKVKLGSYSNVDTVTASLRSSFGGAVELNSGSPLAASTEYPFPRGTDNGFAGTWGLDEGVGYLSDEGTDVAPGGDSAGHMANPETLAGFQGIRAQQGSVLRLTIEPTAAGDVTIGLPTFRRFQGHPEVRWLDGNKAVMLWPDGPAVLWGAHLTYVPDEGLYWPWLSKPLGTPNSLADALQFVYAIFECTDPGDVAAFNTEVNAWYDDFEVSLNNVGSADKHSFSFLLPKGTGETIRFAIVQTVAEVPPLACWPTGGRSTTTWASSGVGKAERWDQAQETKYVVSPSDPLVLQNPGGSAISSAATAPSGWSIQSYVLPLTGDEIQNYRLSQGGTLIASVYPWRGWDWVGGPYADVAGTWSTQSRRGHLHLALVTGGDVTYRRAKHTTPEPGYHDDGAVTSFGDVTLARMAIHRSGQIYMAVTRGSSNDLYLLKSDSDGADFDTGTLLMSNALGGTPWQEKTGAAGVTWFEYDSGTSGPGTQKAVYKPMGSTSFGSPFTFKDDSAADIPVAEGGWSNVAEAQDGQRRLTWCPIVEGETVPSAWYSTDDGETWTRVV